MSSFASLRLGVLFLSLLATAQVLAQATFPTPFLVSLSPLGGKPGSTVQISFKGTDLDAAKSVLLSSLQGAGSRELPITQVPNQKGVLSLALPADMAAGFYDLHLVGRFGVSNPRVFQVSPLAVIDSPGTNTQVNAATQVPLNVALHGVFKTAEPHWFAFEAQKGQRVLGTFVGSDLNSRVSLVGAVTDASGREVARLREGLFDLKVPADGRYTLRVNDLMYGVGDDFAYRLSLTTGAVVWAATKDTLYGWNLPGAVVVPKLRVNSGQPLERLKTDAATAARLVSESPLKSFALPSEDEAPESVSPAATSLQIGQSFGGWFLAGGESRCFDLAFKKGDRFVIEVVSQGTGFPTDSMLLVESVKKDAAGVETLTAQADLNDPAAVILTPSVRLTALDPVYGFEAKNDGVFRLSLSDPLNAANGRRYPYSLRLQSLATPSAEAGIARYPTLPLAAVTGPHEIGSANVWRQGIAAIEVLLPGRTALSETVELTLGNPPPGVTVLKGVVGKGQSVGYIGLQAGPEALGGASVLSGIQRSALLNWAVRDGNREALSTRSGGAPVIGVVAQQAPALIEAVTPGVIEVAADGKIDIPLKVTRHSLFTDALKLKVIGLIDLAKAPEITIAAKALEGKLTLDLKALKLAPGDYGFILQSPAKMPFNRAAGEIAVARASAEKATTAHVVAKKELEGAQAAQKKIQPEDKAALTAAQATLKTLTAKLKKKKKTKASSDKAVKDIVAKNPAKDVTFVVYSPPFHLRVGGTR